MGILDLFKREETTPVVTPPIVDDVLLQALLGGETITRDKAMTIPAVAGAVDFISNAVACMPVKLYKETDGKVDEVKDDTRTKLLNGDTGDTLDAYQMKKALVSDYLMGKGGYCYIRRRRNEVTGLFYVEDLYITVLRTPEPIYKKYQIEVEGKPYRPWDFIKLLRNTKDGASGTGLTQEISKELETAYQTLLYQLGMVKSGGNKRGFLKADRRLGQDEIDVLKTAWRNMYGNNTESVVVLNNGLQFQEASSSSVEMQMNESKRTLTDEINGLFHIYPSDFDRTFKEAIYPVIKAFETALNRDLLLEKEKADHFFEFDVKEIIKATLNERYQAYKTAKETGFLTINEIRRAENLNWIEGLDVVNVGLGAVLYDVEEQKFFTPNTGEATDIETASATAQEDKMVENHELAQAFDESGNSAERELRFNPNHDPKSGRFSTGDGGFGAWGTKVDDMRAEYAKGDISDKAYYLFSENFVSSDDALAMMRSGDERGLDQKADEYFQILKENGDYTPVGPTRDNATRINDTFQGHDPDIELLKTDTGIEDEAELARYKEALRVWTGQDWLSADKDALDSFVANAPKYDGAIYRGLSFGSTEEMDAFMENVEAGNRITMRGMNSSWTSDPEVARRFANHVDDGANSVVITSTKNRTGVPIRDFSRHSNEFEVLAPSTAQWTVLRTEVVERKITGARKMYVYVVEANTDGT